MERCLSRDFDFNGIPSPWIQIKIVRLLSKLGKDDKESSQMMYEIINETLRRSDIGLNAGHAIVYECAAAITHIYPHGTLLDTAAEAITKFIGSHDNNLKYLGLKALNDIIKINPKYALQHQVRLSSILWSLPSPFPLSTLCF
jgi:AP-4 complex subunit epsilon-1